MVLPDPLVSKALVQPIEIHDALRRWNDLNKALYNSLVSRKLIESTEIPLSVSEAKGSQ